MLNRILARAPRAGGRPFLIKLSLFVATVAWLELGTVDAFAQDKAGDKKAADKSDEAAADLNAEKRVIVGEFSGPRAQSTRGWVVEALESSGKYELVEGGMEIAKHGNDEVKLAEVADKHQARAVVVGRVDLKKNVGWSVIVSVHSGKSGALVDEKTIVGGLLPNLRKKILATLMTEISGGLETTEPPEKEVPVEETPAEEMEDDEELEEDDEPSGPRPSPIELGVGIRGFSRQFDYNDTLASRGYTVFPEPNGQPVSPLNAHTLPFAPAPFVFGRLYPLALSSDGFASHIGIAGSFEFGIATKSRAGTQELTNGTSSWTAGLRLRVPLGDSEAGVEAGLGNHRFIISGDEANPTVPDVNYDFIRVGADARVAFGKVRMGVRFFYRGVTSAGKLQQEEPFEWFPQAKGGGLEVGLVSGYQLTKAVMPILGVDMLRYGFNFNPIDYSPGATPNDRIAGGAVDQYISLFIGLQVVMPGDPGEATLTAGETSPEVH